MTQKLELKLIEINDRLKGFSFPEVDLILGIASGGINPSRIVAELLNKPHALIEISFRDNHNIPLYETPKLINLVEIPESVHNILLVDDVSVSGKTLNFAKQFLKNYRVYTFVFKGRADFVLFPEIKNCVIWPWQTDRE